MRMLIMTLVLLLLCVTCFADEMAKGGTIAPFIPDVFSLNGGFREKVDLNGVWEFRHDTEQAFTQEIRIPGVPQSQGIGVASESMKHALNEPFWVQRTFRMRQLGAREHVWLRLGGVLPAAEVHINGQYVGYTKSSRTQQRVDVTQFLKPRGVIIYRSQGLRMATGKAGRHLGIPGDKDYLDWHLSAGIPGNHQRDVDH